MARTLHRTPRHLDDPLRLGPFTLAQWGVALVATALVWLVLTQLPALPVLWRVALGGGVVGVALGLTEGGHGGSLVELPRRAWHSLTAPREYLSGPPRHGPLEFQSIAMQPVEEELPNA